MTFVARKQGAHRRSVAPYAFIVSFGVMSFYTVFAGIAQLALVPVLSAVAMGTNAVFATAAVTPLCFSWCSPQD